MIAPVQLFQPTASAIADFGKLTSGQIFNQAIVPTFNSILQEGDAVREKELERNTAEDIFSDQQDDQFLAQLPRNVVPVMPDDPVEDYDAPAAQAAPAVKAQPVVSASGKPQKGPMSLKLSNYGYASDNSPDYNSNVLRIGHANNKLEDGVSAALTKSLAKRIGLKTGDMFEAVTADGRVLKRRYDDTVPTTYKGKRLPETVDLYELGGSNNFSGKIIDIRPIK